MSASVNNVTLLGNVGKDPEVKSFQNGGKVVNFSIATSESWKDKATGEKKEKTEWHNVAVFSDGLAGVAERYIRKGSKVYVEGQLRTRKWQDQSGNDRYSTEVVLQGFDAKIVLLDGKDSSGSRDNTTQSSDYRGNSGSGRSQADSYGGSSSTQSGFSDDLDDEVPF